MKSLENGILVTLFLTQICFSQWVQKRGPHLNPVDCFALSGNNLLAGVSVLGPQRYAEGGVFLSTDDGVSWVCTELDSLNPINCLMVSEPNIYAGGYTGVFRSTDNGTSWIYTGLEYINALTMLDTNLFAGGYEGVFISTNFGLSWIHKGLSEVTALAVSGVNLFAGTAYDGVFISTNNGTSWNPVNTGLTNTYIHCLAVSGTNIFAGTEEGVFLSTNYGGNWTAASTGLTNSYIFTLLVYDSSLFAGTKNGVYLSDNNGENWIHKGPANVQVHALKMLENEPGTNTVLAGTFGGILISSDYGGEWSMIGFDLAYSEPFENVIGAFAVSDTNIIAVVSSSYSPLGGGSYGAMFLSSNNGDIWRSIYGGDYRWEVSSFAKFTDVDSKIFAGISHGPPWGVLYSNDAGNSWVITNNGLPEYPIINFLVTVDTIVFAQTSDDGNFMSVDDGTNWSLVNYNFPYLDVYASIGTNLFVGGYDGVYISTDYGVSWNYTGLSDVNALSVSGVNLFAGTDGSGIFLSKNNGISWDSVNTGLTNTYVNCFAVSSTNIFVGTQDGVFLSTNNGTNWNDISTGLTNKNIKELAVDTKYIFAFNLITWPPEKLIWRRPLSEVIATIGEVSNQMPKDFILYQNYPNPFNPSTKIKYSVPHLSQVQIKVFDVLGNEIQTLIKEEKPAGTYEIDWNAANLPSGVYFYQLRAGDFIQTKKMILLR